MFSELAAKHIPECAFTGKTKEDFLLWKEKTYPKVTNTLGAFPPETDPDPELIAEWTESGLTKQRWIINVQKHLSAVMLVNLPPDFIKSEKYPAILCCHGHGPFGKEPVMGNESSPGLRESIRNHNYNYGHVMSQKGFITYAIDWIGFGERNDNQKPNNSGLGAGRDWCNLYYLHATMLGMTSLSINIAHGKAAANTMCAFPWVDKNRLGVMGLSGGGTMALWMALSDPRFKATEIICYSDVWAAFGIRDINYCGMQVAPGLYKLVDLPDLQGLLAPRPLLVDIGAHDECFRITTAMQCYRKVSEIYKAAEASGMLEIDLHSGGHAWGGNKSEVFFSKYLSG